MSALLRDEPPTTAQAAEREAKRLRAERDCRCGFCAACFARLAPKEFDPDAERWWRQRLKGSW